MSSLISVIIPTYRRLEMLREAIQSVKAQDYSNIEIIVIDDHSGDDTQNIVDEFPDILYYRNPANKGPGYSRKIGFSHCHGDYVVFLDDDDYYTDNSFFSKAISIFSEDDYVFVSANALIIDMNTATETNSDLNVYGKMDSREYLRGFPFQYKKPHSTFTTIFLKKNLDDAGLLEMDMVNDMAIYMRSMIKGNVFFMSDTIGVYRQHPANISKRINGPFIIANLKEKLAIYRRITDNQWFDSANQWWMEQIKITTSYYVYGSRPHFEDYLKVRNWCIKNTTDKVSVKALFRQYTDFLIDDRICTFKRIIKKVIGKNEK